MMVMYIFHLTETMCNIKGVACSELPSDLQSILGSNTGSISRLHTQAFPAYRNSHIQTAC